jgi:uncharacterized membrane-anchored protein
VGLRERWRRGTSGEGLPGVHGPARSARPTAGDPAHATRALARRLEPGDVVLLDHQDLDRVSAEALAAAHPAAVVNVRPSLSGRHPARGAEVLVAAGIPVVDQTGTGLLAQVREGGDVRVHEGRIYVGDDLVGQGTVQTLETVHEAQDHARAGMNARLEAVGSDAARFLGSHEALLLDGIGLPETGVSLTGRTVLVVGPGERSAAQARALRHWVHDVRPVVVTADDGLQAAVDCEYPPALLVGEVPEELPKIAAKAKRVTAEQAPEGLAATDLAVVLAVEGGAELVVVTGSPASFDEMLDVDREAAAATLAVRLRAGERVVDAPAVLALNRPPIGVWPVLLLLAGGVAALVASLLAVPGSTEMLHRLRDALPW